jgi:hypothetical protein
MTDKATEFRASPLLLVVSVLGVLVPSVLTAWIPVSGQTLERQTVILLVVLWLMMLAAAVPLFLLWRRAFVRIHENRVEFRGLGSVKAVTFQDVESVTRKPDKLVLKSRGGRLGSISVVMKNFPMLCSEISDRVKHAKEQSGQA